MHRPRRDGISFCVIYATENAIGTLLVVARQLGHKWSQPRLVVRTPRCGRGNLGSIPRADILLFAPTPSLFSNSVLRYIKIRCILTHTVKCGYCSGQRRDLAFANLCW